MGNGREMTGVTGAEQKLTEGKAGQLYQRIADLKIVDAESYALIQELVKENRKFIDAIEEKFKDSVAAANRAHKEAIALRTEALARFEENESLAKAKILEYAEACGEGPTVPGVNFLRRWHVEVIDLAVLPREYMVPDLKKIQGIAMALGSECRIPGVIVTPLTQVSIRAE